MKLGLQLGYDDPIGGVAMAQEADRLGFHSVWTSEDAVTMASWIAATTEQIGIGTAIMQMPARTPAMTAMTVATLDQLSGGRVLLGLGTSGPQVVEGWHGVAWGKPLGRTREYVEIVRAALRRETVEHHGAHYDIPYSGEDATGLGKPLKLILKPLRRDVPIYLAAIGPKNVALAAEIADGWLPIFFSPYRFREIHGPSLEGASDDFQIAPMCPVLVGDDVQQCRDMLKPMLALYIGGMGARGKNFYNSLTQRYGFEEAAAKIQELYLSGMKGEAAMTVPDDLVDEIALARVRCLHTRHPGAPARGARGDGGAAPVKEAFAAALDASVERAVLLAGGASKEAWAVDAGGRELLIRRAAGGVIHQTTLSLEHEFEVLRAAHEAGVKVPEPIAYLGEIEGREAFVMERIKGETIGRRIVKSPPAGLDLQLAEELAKIHAIPPERLPFLEQGDTIARFYAELDSVGEPHPAIELGLHWVKERLPQGREPVGDGCWRPRWRARVRSRGSRSPTSTAAACPAPRGRASATVIRALGTSSTTAPTSLRCWTGSSPTSPIRSRISRGRSSAPGASAPTTSTSAGSASPSPTSRAMPS